VDPVGIEPTTP